MGEEIGLETGLSMAIPSKLRLIVSRSILLRFVIFNLADIFNTLKLKRRFKDFSTIFQGCFKEFSRKLLLHKSLEVKSVFEENVKCGSNKFQWYFASVSRKFQGT